MKRVVPFGFLSVAALFLATCGGSDSSDRQEEQDMEESMAVACDVNDPPLFEEGILTVATDSPAYPPRFEGDPENYSGFEGEVANARSQAGWTSP